MRGKDRRGRQSPSAQPDIIRRFVQRIGIRLFERDPVPDHALASPVEADERDLEIAGVAQEVHYLHQIAVADRLVGTDVDALVLVALADAIERGRQRVAGDDVLADGDGEDPASP